MLCFPLLNCHPISLSGPHNEEAVFWQLQPGMVGTSTPLEMLFWQARTATTAPQNPIVFECTNALREHKPEPYF